MKFGPKDKFWVVVDPTPVSEMGDILFQASLTDLELQFKGGLEMDRNPTLYTEKTEAEIEAYGRLVALRASKQLARLSAEGALQGATRLELYDAEGHIVFEADLPVYDFEE